MFSAQDAYLYKALLFNQKRRKQYRESDHEHSFLIFF